MTSIDDLFRKPNVASKRKLEDPSASFLQHHKSQKLNDSTSLRSGGVSGSYSRNNGYHAASIQDEEIAQFSNNDDQNDDDIEAGPELPPDDNDNDNEVDGELDEDDEGRFFGGGVSKQERKVLDYLDENAEDDELGEEKIDLAWLKKTALNFERKINKNAELRAKFENDPIKFVSSEADLDAEIKGLSLLSGHSELYRDFVRSGCAASLVGLLAHENTDIAIAVCELLAELTDEDSGADEGQWRTLVDALLDADVVDLLVSNLQRLDEAEESDRAGVYHVLNVVENFMSEGKSVESFGRNSQLMQWLKHRINKPDPEARAKVGQNRQYAAEILAILLQDNEKNRERYAKIDGVDVLLQLLSAYRKRDPEKDSDEEEFAENVFDCLVSVVKNTEGAYKFLESEGVELCLIMLREGGFSRQRSLRVFDHALGSAAGSEIGERLVDAAGLKPLFNTFMKTKKQDRESIEHIVGIFSSMLRYLPAESAARIRTLAKFVEKDYEKISRLVELRKDYAFRASVVDDNIATERRRLQESDAVGMESEWLSRRLDAGLFSLQALDVVLAWLIAEDDGARRKTMELLKAQGSDGAQLLKASLQEQIRGIEDDDEEGKGTKDVLDTLLTCLG